MRIRWNRIVALVLLIGLGVFVHRGGLATLPHVQVGVAVPNDPVVALATYGVIAVTLIAIARLLAERPAPTDRETHHE